MRRFVIPDNSNKGVLSSPLTYERRVASISSALKNVVTESRLFTRGATRCFTRGDKGDNIGDTRVDNNVNNRGEDGAHSSAGTRGAMGYKGGETDLLGSNIENIVGLQKGGNEKESSNEDVKRGKKETMKGSTPEGSLTSYSWYELLFLHPHELTAVTTLSASEGIGREFSAIEKKAQIVEASKTVASSSYDGKRKKFEGNKQTTAMNPSKNKKNKKLSEIITSASTTQEHVIYASEHEWRLHFKTELPSSTFHPHVSPSASPQEAPTLPLENDRDMRALRRISTNLEGTVRRTQSDRLLTEWLTAFRKIQSVGYIWAASYSNTERAILFHVYYLLKIDEGCDTMLEFETILDKTAAKLVSRKDDYKVIYQLLECVTPYLMNELIQDFDDKQQRVHTPIEGERGVLSNVRVEHPIVPHKTIYRQHQPSVGMQYTTGCPSIINEFIQFGGYPQVPYDMNLGKYIYVSPFTAAATIDFPMSFLNQLNNHNEATTNSKTQRPPNNTKKSIAEDGLNTMLIVNNVFMNDKQTAGVKELYQKKLDYTLSGFNGFLLTQSGHMEEDILTQLLRNDLGNKEQSTRHAVCQGKYIEVLRRLNLEVIRPEFHFQQKRLRLGPSTVHGYGVFAAEYIACNEWIVEYVGLVVSEAIADKRETMYMDTIGGSTYFFKLGNNDIIDATQCGNITRFINHSCTPNCKPVDFGEEDEAVGWHVVIEALRDIECGEELFYNYRLSEGALGKEKCFCGSKNCVGLM